MMKSYSSIFLLLCWVQVFAQDNDELINAIGLQSGSYMYQTPSSYQQTNLMGGSIMNYSPEALFDQGHKVWCSQKKSQFPHEFVMELTEPYIIEKLVFNNQVEATQGIATKKVSVAFSTTDPDYGFVNIGEYSLEPGNVHEIEIDPGEARWIKLSILSNHGNKSYTELSEFQAWGKHKHPEIRPVNVEGKWETNWGWVQFGQNGSSITGNYQYNGGVIRYGGINRNMITYKWVEDIVNQQGWTLLFMNREGTRLTGVWCQNEDWSDYGFWIMERDKGVPMEERIASMTVEESNNVVVDEVEKEVVEEMGKSLEEEGKLILYGINFKTNSSELLPESFAVLNQVAELLNQQEDLIIRIEGHTDNVGSDSYNLTLSQDRASSVKSYFVNSKGVDENRIEALGKGEVAPIASNDLESGRSANRRVEIYPIK